LNKKQNARRGRNTPLRKGLTVVDLNHLSGQGARLYAMEMELVKGSNFPTFSIW
jgi:hypothetical protein